MLYKILKYIANKTHISNNINLFIMECQKKLMLKTLMY